MHAIRIQGEKERQQKIYYEVDLNNPPIGIGGMGQVFRGKLVSESDNKKKDVAIKFLDEGLPAHIVERAKREAEINVHHENLLEMLGFVQIIEQTPSGIVVKRNHVVSELLNGVMLYDIIHNNKTTNYLNEEIPYAVELLEKYKNNRAEFAVTVIRSMLSGVMALHDNGYIHRDLDPSNVMVTDDYKIKIIDYGIAKKIGALSIVDRPVTITGQVVCKPEYAAPEQISGDFKLHNKTTDLYSLGIMLYEFTTGHLPFTGDINEVLEHHKKHKVSVKDVSDKSLKKIITKATAKKQSERYQTAAEFRADLDRISFDNEVDSGINKDEKSRSFSLLWKIVASIAVILFGLIFGAAIALISIL